MPKIKIKDLPQGQKISKDELKKIKGGATPVIVPGAGYNAYINYSALSPYLFNQPTSVPGIYPPINKSMYVDTW